MTCAQGLLHLLWGGGPKLECYRTDDITTLEVSSAIKSLKLGKAPGPDGIHNEFIKNCGTKLVH